MTDIGVIFNNSTLLLELLTKDELGSSVWADDTPSAVITVHDGLSVKEVASVKLKEMSDIGEYAYTLEIPSEWVEGSYVINYSATVNGMELTLQEIFQLEHYEVEEIYTGTEDEEVEFGDESTYLLPPDFQIACDLIVTETGVTIKPKEALKYNHTYSLVLTKGLRNALKDKTFEKTRHIAFTSSYSPLYATPLEVRAIIRNFFPYFAIDEIYAALRDAGEKAHVYKDLVPDANNSRFKLALERDDYYFALTKYQAYEASRVLLTKLLLIFLQGEDTPFGGGSNNDEGMSGFTLGDFVVSASGGGDSASDKATLLASNKALLKDLIERIEQDLKFWQDSMMGHNKRSYAKPKSSSFRSDGGSPESRDF